MKLSLQNEQLTATFKTSGGELCSLVDTNGIEYIWNANPSHWARHTPILFPLVGKILDNTYTHQESTYTLGSHGFARDQEFDIIEHTATSITFKLSSSVALKRVYPFDFNLYIIYTLHGQTLDIAYKVENTDVTPIAFKIGAHPGFNCPLEPSETFEDYYLSFEQEENAKLQLLTSDGYLQGESIPFNKQQINLKHELFDQDALVLNDFNSHWIDLRSRHSGKGVRVTFEGFPFLGIWSPSTQASPFVCIEPWFGHADRVSDSIELMDKQDLVKLPVGETFNCVHSITVL